MHPGQCLRSLAAEISRLATEARQQPLLVLDEAQHLRPEVLEDLRLLAHFAMDSAPRLGLPLAGLTEWQRRLARAVPTVQNQRIVVCQPRAGLAAPNSGNLCSAACGWPAASGRRWNRLRWRRCCWLAHSLVAPVSGWTGGRLLPARKDPGQARLGIDAFRSACAASRGSRFRSASRLANESEFQRLRRHASDAPVPGVRGSSCGRRCIGQLRPLSQ